MFLNNAELNRALGDAIENLEEAKKAVAAAQSEVDRTAAQVEIIANSLGKEEEKFEESRLELEEKEAEFKAVSGTGKKVDRSSLTQGIIDSENAESRLLQENAAIERRMTETERQLRSASGVRCVRYRVRGCPVENTVRERTVHGDTEYGGQLVPPMIRVAMR